MIKKIIVCLILLTVISAPVHAFEPSEWKKEGGTYWQTAGNKFGFGLKNVLLGWTEFFNEPWTAMHNHESIAFGFGKGLWHTVADTLGGAVHLITFWCPKTDIPLPNGGVKSGCVACSAKA